jgi:hypothetical protein
MKNKLLLASFFLGVYAQAGIQTSIVHVGEAIDSPDHLEIHVNHNGRVYNVEKENHELINEIKFAYENELEIKLNVEAETSDEVVEEVLSVELVTLSSEEKTLLHGLEDLNPMTGYVPTNLESYDEAAEIFSRLSEDHRHKNRSQCYNRAYIWSKKMYDEDNVHSMKIFVFYTKKYRKEVSKKWWYHVAPMVMVNGEYIVMDKEFTRKPVTDQQWEYKFAARRIGDNDYRCPKIDNINEYYETKNMADNYCNILHASMYYWGPNDLKKTARTGEIQTQFKNSKLRYAAKEAFRKWKDVYEMRKDQ